jgi:triacylglycerol lipase
MLARIQQAITLTLFAIAAIWAGTLVAAGRPGWALAGAVLILFGHAVFLAIEFILLAWVGRDDAAPRPRVRDLVSAWWGEVLCAPRVFCWRQPFRSHAEPDHLPPAASGRRGVLLVHGFICNRGFWNPWMKRLRAAGVPFVAVNLEPVFGSIDAYPEILDAAARRLRVCTGLAPLVVAHSMGGLAVRAWLRQHPEAAHHVVTIGTPHRGTWLARFGLTRNGHEMRIGGRWLATLHEGEATDAGRYTCYYSHCDNIVFPPSTATLPGADNRHVAATAHVHLAFQEAVFNEVWARTAGSPASADAVALAAR